MAEDLTKIAADMYHLFDSIRKEHRKIGTMLFMEDFGSDYERSYIVNKLAKEGYVNFTGHKGGLVDSVITSKCLKLYHLLDALSKGDLIGSGVNEEYYQYSPDEYSGLAGIPEIETPDSEVSRHLPPLLILNELFFRFQSYGDRMSEVFLKTPYIEKLFSETSKQKVLTLGNVEDSAVYRFFEKNYRDTTFDDDLLETDKPDDSLVQS